MIEHLHWDSDFFGYEVGAVSTPIDTFPKLDELLAEFNSCKEKLVYVYLPLSGMDLVSRILEERGALLADVRAELTVDLDERHSGGIDSKDVILRDGERRDAKEAGELASKCFRGSTRFYRDPHIPDEKCDLLYRIWAAGDILDSDGMSLVSASSDKLLGFCTAVKTGPANARLGLICVSSRARGRGIGHGLLSGMAGRLRNDGCERLSAVTQLVNTAAIRMYEKAGFLLESTTAVVHLWMAERRD